MPDARWMKSSYSGPTGGNCVEVTLLPGGDVAVRDSRRARGPALVFPAAQWAAFIAAAKAGQAPGRSNSPFLAPARNASHSRRV